MVDFQVKGDYALTTEKNVMDVPLIHHYLRHESYWANGIDYKTVETSIQHSLCFGLFSYDHENEEIGAQVGFARVITDYATFGYLADVFILKEHRGKGLSKWLMENVMTHPDLQGLRRLMLVTRDAQGLYRQYGFEVYENKDNGLMGIRRKTEEVYNKS
ncbi:GNAT family N-acetyltransferase [Pseudalkalibacillus sp. SCS-8]|uniref:GNAT family N-acetyltransferase n=1 Tax=Pseudalkalibacillus nanhaiensis TaxID=3115291 RepID=UPI0032DA06FA